jgi:hypothetical protein
MCGPHRHGLGDGRDLGAKGVRVVAMGGSENIGHFVRRYGPSGSGAKLTGLYDAGEQDMFRRA